MNDKDKINLTDLNKQKKSFTPPKLKNPFKKQTGPNRDEVGKFATTAGGGGLKSIKKFNWKRATPLIAIVTLVGGFLVFQSFAAGPSVPGRQTCEQWGIPRGIKADPIYAGYGGNAPGNLERIYRDFHRVALIEDDRFYWEVTRPAELKQEHAGDTMWLKCAVGITIFKEMVQTTPAINTKEVVEEMDIPTENVVKSIYAKDIRVGSQKRPLTLLPLQQTLGAMNGDMYLKDGVEHEYADENFVQRGGNYLTDFTFSNGIPAALKWRDNWSGKVKVCALVYEAGPDVRPASKTPGSINDVGLWVRDYSKSPYSFILNVNADIEHRQTGNHDTALIKYRLSSANLKDLQDYNKGKKSFFSNWRNPNSIVIPFAKFYVCSAPIEKTTAELKIGNVRYYDATMTQLKPTILFNGPKNNGMGNAKAKVLFERFDIVKVP